MSVLTRETRELESVTILFCGDSGDGMQLTGTQFTNTTAVFGNDVSTLPNYPAEIRAPAGSLAGVSAFQLNFSSQEIHTPGDNPDVLVAMNPAALKVNIEKLHAGGVLIVNEDAFSKPNLKKAGYEENPLDNPNLMSRYQVHKIPITTLTFNATEPVDLDRKAKNRCKNFFALGLIYWLYNRPLDQSLNWIDQKFKRLPEVAEANRLALRAGYAFGETTEMFHYRYTVPKAKTKPGLYRIISGNEAMALGLTTAAHLAGKPLVYSTYPITPASDILHALSRLRHLDVRTLQAEDEIAAMGATVGAAFGGAMAATGTSGPGLCLKSEAIGLAIMLELPMVIVDVQRGGPSTGLPTKTEQGDLLQAVFGRNGESPIPVLAAASPSDCFKTGIEAFRIAVKYMTPVMVLTEGYLANGAEPWRIPRFEDLEPLQIDHPTNPEGFFPYSRDDKTLARPWVIPGTPDMEHRIGGLEKEHVTGNVSYDPLNHEFMCRLRGEKVARIADVIPPLKVTGSREADLLVLSWGGTYGASLGAVERAIRKGFDVAHVHLRHLNPFPRDLGEILKGYSRILIPELNFGQLALMVRAKYLVETISFPKVQGMPFIIEEIEQKIEELFS